MRRSGIGKLLFVALLAVISCATLSASPLFGQFTIAGTVTVTNNAITWQSTGPGTPHDKAGIGGIPLSGSFVALDGTTVTIRDLNRASAPVFDPSAPFSPPVPFISFDAAPAFPMLQINEFFNGTFTAAGCLAAPPAEGQLCTPGPPVTPNPSPFSFVNLAAGQSLGSFVMSGITADGSSKWTGVFTTQFNVPFQSVIAAFGTGGSGTVSNSFSATFTLTPAGVPEPGSVALLGLGLGLVALSAGLRRRRVTRR
jgi:PEP-CTERM motif